MNYRETDEAGDGQAHETLSTEFRLNPTEIEYVLLNFSKEAIEKAVAFTKNKVAERCVANVPAYFLKVLQGGWAATDRDADI